MPCSDRRASRSACLRRIAVVARHPIKGELQHDFAGARRPGAITLDVFQAFQETANIDQQPGEFGAYGVQRPDVRIAEPRRSFRSSYRHDRLCRRDERTPSDRTSWMWCARAGKIRAQPLTGLQLMNFDQWSAVAPTPPCKPTERALDFIDDDTDATEVRFDVLLRQNKVLRTIGADDRIQRLRRRACRFSTLAAAASAPARMEWDLFGIGHWTCLIDVGLFT